MERQSQELGGGGITNKKTSTLIAEEATATSMAAEKRIQTEGEIREEKRKKQEGKRGGYGDWRIIIYKHPKKRKNKKRGDNTVTTINTIKVNEQNNRNDKAKSDT